MGNSKSGNCPWTTVYNVHGICPVFHEEMLEKFHGQCPQYPGHCPWIPWTLSTHSMGSMDIVHTFHGICGQCPCILWKISMDSMENVQDVHGIYGLSTDGKYEVVRVFTMYVHGGHLGHITWIPYLHQQNSSCMNSLSSRSPFWFT